MMTYLSNIPAPKGNSNLNSKKRTVRCENCKYETVTDLTDAKCGHCGRQLITVIINELATGDSKSA